MSKGLETIKTLRGFNKTELNNDENVNNSLDIIEDELKVLEIIKKKKVNIDLLYASSGVEQYNDELVRVYGMWFVKDRQLTQEEFELLKRCLENV